MSGKVEENCYATSSLRAAEAGPRGGSHDEQLAPALPAQEEETLENVWRE